MTSKRRRSRRTLSPAALRSRNDANHEPHPSSALEWGTPRNDETPP